jgi:phage tail-like protein
MALGQRSDPYTAYNFLVEIEGLVVGGFTEVTGLQIEVEVQDYREGGLNDYIHRLAGPTRYPSNLILKRGLADIDLLWAWHQAVTHGIILRRNGSIVLLDPAGSEKWRWNFVGAYPVRWLGPELRSGSANVAVETLELVHRGIVNPLESAITLAADIAASLF